MSEIMVNIRISSDYIQCRTIKIIKKLPESFVYSDIDMYADSMKSL